MEQAEMADRRRAKRTGRQPDLRAGTCCVVVKAPADRGRRPERVVGRSDGQDRGLHGREAGEDRLALAPRVAEFHSGTAEAPLVGDAGWEILKPAELPAREVACQC